MKTRIRRIFAASMIAIAGSAPLSPGSARADLYETNSFFCSGPYTSGYGTATMTAGTQEHWRGNSTSSDVKIKVWTNTARTTRTSYYHGAGSQSLIVMGNGSISGLSRGCHYIG